jgi:surfactin synthase thioesterase subunit/acyl carrier protein
MLPGREDLVHRPPVTELERLVAELTDAVAGYGARRTAFFGHSMGAVLAFEVARELRRRGEPGPDVLAVSGAAAPHTRADPRLRGPALDDTDALCAMGGVPAGIRHSRVFERMLLPALSADVSMVRRYRYRPEQALDVALALFGGRDDPLVPTDTLTAWGQLTTGTSSIQLYSGGHFFIWRVLDRVADTIIRIWSEPRRVIAAGNFRGGTVERDEFYAWITAWLKESGPRPELPDPDPHTHLWEAGHLDSLSMLELIVRLEETLGRELDIERGLQSFSTMATIYDGYVAPVAQR